ncbi:regulatory protein YycI of two-component signal transduction system YycFG [Acetoanaerobium pronyense]|uniref:Regulatory protein YycI of two-component signal transduction system YycFG n=1 Tax=Acetoanaerobium pronyense TaxID=1482736 RepID=A0ABS4KLS6_9FIRM|nr:two-component system regulatory protein YycI [Acetoanaerobium pronyense]MBP2028721.1 regulatory protein YycI of two-component signal transduction system YycFG [Acetoanaerobium pronyense]
MDWAKAKTYLILAFAITNIILMSNIFSDYGGSLNKTYFSKESIENFNELLTQQGISLSTELPKDTPKMGTLKVEYEKIDEEKLDVLYSDYGMGLQVMDRKQITINSYHNIQEISKENVIKESEKFMKAHDDTWDYEIKYIKEEDEFTTIYYNSLFEDMFLEESYMSFTYDIHGGFNLEMIRLHVLEKGKNKKEVMTSVEAVMRTLSQLERGDDITEIRLGYYLYMDQSVPITQTRSATAFPSWRIKTADGRYFYVQAFEF